MPAETFHVRSERATRARLHQYDGRDLPTGVATAWCGAIADGQWVFMDAAHLVNSLADGGMPVPCRACLLAVRAIIDTELNDA